MHASHWAGRAARLLTQASLSVVLLSATLGLAGCQALTEVDAPDVVQPDDFANPAGASALALGGITRFYMAFGGDYFEDQVKNSGLIADELLATSADVNSEESVWDARNPHRQGDYSYTGLQEARQQLLTAIGSFQQVAPDSTARIGQLFALLGYVSVFLGENYCAGVPLSHRDADLGPVYGQPLTTVQLFDSAVAAFDAALIQASDSARIRHLAQVGRGRALLNQGRFSEAAQAVAGVPTDYVYNATYLGDLSASSINGFFFNPNFYRTSVTVPEREGLTGINWRTAHDPRVELISRSPPLVDGVELWGFVPYQTPDAPVRLAGGIEARLIEGEAALQAGDVSSWLAIHNTLRTSGTQSGVPATWDAGTGGVPNLAPLADPGTEAARVDLHFGERAFWLFLTGHRHGDLRRLVRQYGQSVDTVFPTGMWRGGTPYGPATNVEPPLTEKTNPHYSGCLNRDA